MKNKLIIPVIFSIAFTIVNAQPGVNTMQTGPGKVELRRGDSNYQLIRGGKIYFIRGGGGSAYPERIAAYGGNSIRTWGTRGAPKILDSAYKDGVTVLIGLDGTAQRHGVNY